MKPPFAMMAGYNAWCNERVYDVAAQLSDADYCANRGAFFKSVQGTLNRQPRHRRQVHCVLTDFKLHAPSLDLMLFQRQTRIGLT